MKQLLYWLTIIPPIYDGIVKLIKTIDETLKKKDE